jgi:hypothetical protein
MQSDRGALNKRCCVMRPIKLSGAKSAAPTTPKPAMVFEDEADSRYGFYRAKENIDIVRYRIPFHVEKGQKVEVVEDKGDRVLVHLNETSTIYMDSEPFFRDFERVLR